jgi:hexosaminidase
MRGQLMLRLEDDGPRGRARLISTSSIPAGVEAAPLAGSARRSARGRIPCFFSWPDDPARKFKPAKTAHGELELHAGCDGRCWRPCRCKATVPIP